MMLLPFERGMFAVSYSDHDIQIVARMCIEPPQYCYIAQIPGHTNYARSVRQHTGLCFSCEMAVATLEPFSVIRGLHDLKKIFES
jgi:hypothetical protein